MMKFLNPKFWFNFRPGPLIPMWNNIVIAIVILSFVLFIVFRLLKKSKRGLYSSVSRQLSNLFLVNGIIGLLLLFFTYEIIIFLSARFWFVLWFIAMIIWFIFIIKKMKEIPAKKEKKKAEDEYKKYIP